MLPTLHTTRLTLSPFTPADAPLVQRYAGDARVASMAAFIPHPYPDGLAGQWIASHLPDHLARTSTTLAIRARDTGELRGAIGLNLTLEKRLGEVGYWVGAPFWNQGICTEAARRIIQYGFDDLGLETIRAHHFPHNPASGRVMKKAGMTRIGVIPRCTPKDGQLLDAIQWQILKTDFDTQGE
ncbi:ribosomal-protein-alanine N-acetyltransferase [Ereboglobus sp. PH5-10]|uniref:GNAT family N-acetyltransferase n=1 Tax=Ereboglobus sp. PH5-10 TaxID=2940629 RepID=UPI002406E287|nr:GNAT family N-acetyltransferase [Ereboglobus sp. PH5-10]MDF9827578.1 ribosomal-protein-alanine N-acetyltransferase [Ereboglobus sp. PH5-10]